MELCREHRSESQTMSYLSAGRVEVKSEMPLGEVLFDFYGKLKMITRGYGSFDYEPIEYRKPILSKLTSWLTKNRSTRYRTWCTARSRAPALALLRTTG